jgi:UPF0176 protein
MSHEFINIAAYKFVQLDNLRDRKATLLSLGQSLELKGTVLLSSEGINLFLAGHRDAIDTFLVQLRAQPEFEDFPVKESISDHQPFNRMLVRIKKEIIAMGIEAVRPCDYTSPKISAAQLKTWLDEGKELTLLDVRNDYEIEIGTFANATAMGIDRFRDFPVATQQLSEEVKSKPVVMFCTGGIRCEKAGPLMEQQGFKQIYQLDGGILKYFEECGGDHYNGDCFVFDKRVAVDPELNETELEQCYKCQAIVDEKSQASDQYDPPNSCPACFESVADRMKTILAKRGAKMLSVTTPLPGSIPYDNVRPMNVPLRFDRKPAVEFLCAMHAHLDERFWRDECAAGRVTYKATPIEASQIVRSGWRVEHLVPQTVEPDVSNDIRFLYEDDDVVAIDKPAPLPMHASGRFNRNSLIYFLQQVFAGSAVRILHRLDANTTGVVVLAKTKSAAQFMHPQFINGEAKKTYLARVVGAPPDTHFTCAESVSSEASTAGSRTISNAGGSGLEASTDFSILQRFADGTTLLECQPLTGRTHQIRLHLQHLGFPIVGDPTYNSADESVRQSLSVDDEPMCLHAWRLEIRPPGSNLPVTFEASRPAWSL